MEVFDSKRHPRDPDLRHCLHLVQAQRARLTLEGEFGDPRPVDVFAQPEHGALAVIGAIRADALKGAKSVMKGMRQVELLQKLPVSMRIR